MNNGIHFRESFDSGYWPSPGENMRADPHLCVLCILGRLVHVHPRISTESNLSGTAFGSADGELSGLPRGAILFCVLLELLLLWIRFKCLLNDIFRIRMLLFCLPSPARNRVNVVPKIHCEYAWTWNFNNVMNFIEKRPRLGPRTPRKPFSCTMTFRSKFDRQTKFILWLLVERNLFS